MQRRSARDVLGALMGLGFERDLLGIFCILRQNESFVFLATHIAPYVSNTCQGDPAYFRTLPGTGNFRKARSKQESSSPRLDAWRSPGVQAVP